MNHPQSLLSLDNMCEVPIAAGKLLKKYPGLPRRVGLASSLATLNEAKRPGEYYIQKLSLSLVHLPKMAKRPLLGISVSGSDTSKDSDDALLVMSHAECPDLRFSSLTAHSDIVARVEKKDADEDALASSISTITLENDVVESPKRLGRSQSTPTVETHAHPISLARTRTASSSFLLTRTKTKYYNPKEKKERQQLRKKVYDDNDNDDDILVPDMDLVFNVPMVKNYGDIYRYHAPAGSLRSDLLDDKYFYTNAASMKPCPLPGRLTQSSLNLDTTLASMPEDEPLENDVSFGTDPDGEILNNISAFYGQRSVSYLKLVKQTRDHHTVYKLPSYIRLQSSIEDLSLVSPEKLDMVDQTRPINLPPKCASDKARHSREFHRALSGYELSTKHQNGARKKLGELFILNQQTWFKLMMHAGDPKEFASRLVHDKEKIRKVAWESVVSERFRFDLFMNVLSANCPKGHVDLVRQKFTQLEAKCLALAPAMRASRDAEYDRLIALVLARPVYANFLQDSAARRDSDFDPLVFRANYKHLLYVKSMSPGGLKKYHEMFIIPMFLILFQGAESVESIYTLMQLFDRNILNPEVLGDLNRKLANWKDLSRLSSSSLPYKVLSKFDSLKEFEYLTYTSFFELLVQLNDRLPLSLSAPSTPIVAQGGFPSMTLANHSGEFSDGTPASLACNSLESFADLNFSSVYLQSSSMSLIGIFLQLLVVYSNSPKSKKLNFLRLFQTFLLTVFKYYHINWNSHAELVRSNKSIKLNNSADEFTNLESFLDKWKDMFKKT